MRRLIMALLLLYLLITAYRMIGDSNPSLAYIYATDAPELSACQIPQSLPAGQIQCRIPIGIINSFTDRRGVCLSGGTEHKRGYEVALAEIRAINGCQVELVQIDDAGNNTRAREGVLTLANTNVPLILGAYSSGATLEAAAEAARVRIPLLVPSASSELITSMGYEWVFRLNATSADYVSQALALTATLDDAPAVGILYENTVFGESAAVAVTAQAEDLGVSIVAFESFQPGVLSNALANNPDRLALRVARLRDTQPAAIFLIANSVDDALNLLKLSRRERLQPQLFVGIAGAFVSPDFLEQAGDEVENLVVTAQWSPDVAWGGNSAANKQFITNFTGKYGQQPGMRSVQTHTALWVAKAAIEQAAQAPNCAIAEIEIFRLCVRDALRTLRLEETLFGPIDFDDIRGQNSHEVLLLQAVKIDGHYQFVTVYPAAYQRQPVRLETEVNHGG